MTDDRAFPTALTDIAGIEFDLGDYEDDPTGVDYEPFEEFMSAEETREWFQAWTGNSEVDGSQFRIFGKDGAGGLVGFWLVRPAERVTGQPVVYLGSEGETTVLAQDLGGYLWLLADGFGPVEIIDSPDRPANPRDELIEIAERHAPGRRQPAVDVVAAARQEFPDFESTIDSLCR